MIRIRHRAWILGLGAASAFALVGCGQKAEHNAAPQVEEKTFGLTPASAPVKVAFLVGELKDMKISERVEQGTGKVVEPPTLRATLHLQNTSREQTARLISGKVTYMGADGNSITLAEGRQDTSFKFHAYQMDRLDPGMKTSQDIEIPFPAAALKGKTLRDIRLELRYIPTPYKEESVNIPVTLQG